MSIWFNGPEAAPPASPPSRPSPRRAALGGRASRAGARIGMRSPDAARPPAGASPPRSASRSPYKSDATAAPPAPPAPGPGPVLRPGPEFPAEPEQALRTDFSPWDVEAPLDAVAVAADTEVVFLEVEGGEVCDRKNRKKTVQQKYVYKIGCKEWAPGRRGTATDCRIVRENWHGTRLHSTKELKPRPDWSPHGTRRGGDWRLRVSVNDVDEYLHKIAAYAFSFDRDANPDVGWHAFKGKFAGDHLPFLDPSGTLRTRPEWVKAGWVEAVTAGEHDRRNVELAESRQLQADAARLAQQPRPPDLEEKAERFLNWFFAERTAKPRRRSLHEAAPGWQPPSRPDGSRVSHSGDQVGPRPSWSTLVAEVEEEPSSGSDADLEGLPLYLQARGCGPCTRLLVRQPRGRQAGRLVPLDSPASAHSLHVLYCMQRAREQAAANR